MKMQDVFTAAKIRELRRLRRERRHLLYHHGDYTPTPEWMRESWDEVNREIAQLEAELREETK